MAATAVTAGHDLAQAMRALVRAPGVTVGTSLLLGLGVAATATLFAFVDAVLLRPLPYDQPDRLVMMFESNVSQDRIREGPSPGTVLDWVERNDAFDAITAQMSVSATLRGSDGGTPIAGVHVTRGFFDVYRRQPRLGRTFRADDFEGAASITSRQASSGEPVIVLSYRLWQTLGSDAQIVGRTISVEGHDWRVIGVMPEDFAVPDATATFWAPWEMRTSYRGPRFPNGLPRDARFLRVVGRMKAGISIEGAEARMQTLASRMASDIRTRTPVGRFGSFRSRMKSHARAGWSSSSSLRRCFACCCWFAPTSPVWPSLAVSPARGRLRFAWRSEPAAAASRDS